MASNNVIEATDANFQAEVLNSDVPVIVDFWAEWCGPCRVIAPVVDNLAEQFEGRVKVAKLNVDENQKTAIDYGVRGIPTLLVFKSGEVVEQVVGANKGAIGRLFESHAA